MSDAYPVFPAPGRKARGSLDVDMPLLRGYQWPYVAVSGAEDGPTVSIIVDEVALFVTTSPAIAENGRIVGVGVPE